MAGKKTAFSVAILAETKGFKKGMDEAEGTLGKLEKGAQKLMVPLGAASGAVVALGKQAFDSASALQQSTGAVESVFGRQAAQVQAFAATAAQAVGLSKNQYNELATVLGSQLKNLGTNQDEIVGKTNDLITLGGDLAATFGGTTADAVSALSSLMRGERDPIERYGVSIKQATIEAKMAEMGLTDLTGEAKTAAENQAMLALLMEQTAAAHGAYAREAATAAGAQQTATAQWENAKAALGEALLPYVAQAAQWVAEFSRKLGENPAAVQAAGAVILGLTGTLGTFIGVMKTISAVTAAAETATLLLNAAWLANPVTATIAGLTAVAGAFIYAYNHCEKFKQWVDICLALVRNGFARAGEWIENAIYWGVTNAIRHISDLISWVRSALSWFSSLWQASAGADRAVYGSVSNPDILGIPSALGMIYAVPTPSITASVPAFTPARLSLPRRPSAPAGHVYNITINGALDSEATAREIKRLLDRENMRQSW